MSGAHDDNSTAVAVDQSHEARNPSTSSPAVNIKAQNPRQYRAIGRVALLQLILLGAASIDLFRTTVGIYGQPFWSALQAFLVATVTFDVGSSLYLRSAEQMTHKAVKRYIFQGVTSLLLQVVILVFQFIVFIPLAFANMRDASEYVIAPFRRPRYTRWWISAASLTGAAADSPNAAYTAFMIGCIFFTFVAIILNSILIGNLARIACCIKKNPPVNAADEAPPPPEQPFSEQPRPNDQKVIENIPQHAHGITPLLTPRSQSAAAHVVRINVDSVPSDGSVYTSPRMFCTGNHHVTRSNNQTCASIASSAVSLRGFSTTHKSNSVTSVPQAADPEGGRLELTIQSSLNQEDEQTAYCHPSFDLHDGDDDIPSVHIDIPSSNLSSSDHPQSLASSQHISVADQDSVTDQDSKVSSSQLAPVISSASEKNISSEGERIVPASSVDTIPLRELFASDVSQLHVTNPDRSISQVTADNMSLNEASGNHQSFSQQADSNPKSEQQGGDLPQEETGCLEGSRNPQEMTSSLESIVAPGKPRKPGRKKGKQSKGRAKRN